MAVRLRSFLSIFAQLTFVRQIPAATNQSRLPLSPIVRQFHAVVMHNIAVLVIQIGNYAGITKSWHWPRIAESRRINQNIPQETGLQRFTISSLAGTLSASKSAMFYRSLDGFVRQERTKG
jgi:hypothetical protein